MLLVDATLKHVCRLKTSFLRQASRHGVATIEIAIEGLVAQWKKGLITVCSSVLVLWGLGGVWYAQGVRGGDMQRWFNTEARGNIMRGGSGHSERNGG